MYEVLSEYLLLPLPYVLLLAGGGALANSFRTSRRTYAVAGLACVLIGALLLIRQSRSEFWDVDKCLDSGGRYSAELHICEHDSDR